MVNVPQSSVRRRSRPTYFKLVLKSQTYWRKLPIVSKRIQSPSRRAPRDVLTTFQNLILTAQGTSITKHVFFVHVFPRHHSDNHTSTCVVLAEPSKCPNSPVEQNLVPSFLPARPFSPLRWARDSLSQSRGECVRSSLAIMDAEGLCLSASRNCQAHFEDGVRCCGIK